MYDNLLEREGGPKKDTTLPNAAATLFGDSDLISSDDESDDESDDSSVEYDVIES